MKKKALVIIAVAAALAVGISCACMWRYASKAVGAASGHILENVSCGGIEVGGLTKKEAEKKIESHVSDMQKSRIILKAGHKEKEIGVREFDVDFDVKGAVGGAYDAGRKGSVFSRFAAVRKAKEDGLDIPFEKSVTEKKAKYILRKYEDDLVARAENAGIRERNGKGVIVKERDGHRIVFDDSVDAVRTAVDDWNGKKMKINLVVETEHPDYSSDDLKGCTDVMGTYETDYSGSPWGRCKNIENGTRLINGTIVKPDETFSVYKCVSPFDDANGYYKAPTISGETHVDDYGGGICQVSTTLYNAVIRAELKVKERHNHTQAIYYVPLSADAAIAGKVMDFKFVNSSDDLIYISGKTKGKKVRFTVFGNDKRDKDREVTFESRVISMTSPTKQVIGTDPNLSEGAERIDEYGATGYSAQLWKIVKVNGKVKNRSRFNSSSYQMVPIKVYKGTKSSGSSNGNDKGKTKKEEGSEEPSSGSDSGEEEEE